MKKILEKYNWENIFYATFVYIFYLHFSLLMDSTQWLTQADWRFPLNLFPPITTVFGYWMWAYGVLTSFILLALIPWRYSSFAALFLWCIWYSLLMSFGRIFHSQHGFFLASLGISVAVLFKQRNKTLDYAMAAVTYIYMASGWWKLLNVLRAENLWEEAASILPNHVAFGISENYRAYAFLFLKLFMSSKSIAALSWFAIIAMQILTPLGVIFSRGVWKIPFLLILISFHIMAEIVVGPAFPSQITLLTLFIGILLYRNKEMLFLNGIWRSFISLKKKNGEQELPDRLQNLNNKVNQAPLLISVSLYILGLLFSIIPGSKSFKLAFARKIYFLKSPLHLAKVLVEIEQQSSLPLITAQRSTVFSSQVYDFAVIGSGPGGLMATRHLLQQGRSVVWLEEGTQVPRTSDDFPADWYRFYTRQGLDLALNWPPINVAQGHCWGGGGRVNGAIYRRPSPEVLKHWEQLAQKNGFPLQPLEAAFDQVESLTEPQVELGEFIDMESRLRTAAQSQQLNFQTVKSWHRQGRDSVERVDLIEKTISKDLAQQLERAELRVDRVSQEGSLWRAQGENSDKILAKNIVLAAGARGTPFLLKKSGMLSASQLSLGVQPVQRFIAEYDDAINPLSGRVPPFTLASDSHFSLALSASPELALRTLMGLSSGADKLSQQDLKRFLIFNVSIASSAQLNLTSSQTYISWKKTREDLAHMEEGVALMIKWMRATGAQKIWIAGPSGESLCLDVAQKQSHNLVKKSAWSIYHMSSSLPFFKGPKGLFVADSSQLPTVPHTNPQGSIMAYAHALIQSSKFND